MLIGLAVFLGAMGGNPLEKGDPDHPSVPRKIDPISLYFTNKLMGPTYDILCEKGDKARDIITRMPHEVINVTTDDGIKLVGYFWANEKKTDKTAILIHGYNSNGFIDFSAVGYEYLQHGYNILIVTNRASGLSGGKWIGFGVLESKDSLKWVDWVTERYPDGDIVLEGDSLGAATCCMMSDKGLPANVKAIVSDCAFEQVKTQFINMFRSWHVPAHPLVETTEFWCKHIAGYDFTTYSPLKSVSDTTIPIIFVHGKADRYIPYVSCEHLYAACASDKDICLVDGAGHAASYARDPEKFNNAVFPFLEKHFSKKEEQK